MMKHTMSADSLTKPCSPRRAAWRARSLAVARLVLLWICLAPLSGLALTWHYYGGGGANGNWSNPANWLVNGVPPANNTNIGVIFLGSANGKTSQVDIAGLTLRALEFQCTNHLVDAPVARTLTLMALGSNTPAVRVIKPNNFTWFKVTFGANLEVALSGPCRMYGDYAAFESSGGPMPTDQIVFSGRLSGAGSVHVDGEETLELVLQGALGNTYTGGTFVHSNGRLLLNKSSGLAVPGAVTAEATWTCGIELLRPNQIGDAAPVTLRNAYLDLNGHDEAIGALSLMDGEVYGANAAGTALGLLTLNGDVTVPTGSAESKLGARVALGTPVQSRVGRQFIVNSGSLEVPGGPVSGTAILRKLGQGLLSLNGSNTYSGLTVVEEGNLRVGHSQALGAATAGTYVASQSRVYFGSGLTVAEPFDLVGETNGLQTVSTIRVQEGPVTLTGPIQLQHRTRFLSGDAGFAAMPLTVRGPISGPGALVITGGESSPVVFAGVATNTYQGGTVIDGHCEAGRTGNAGTFPGNVEVQAGKLKTTAPGQLTGDAVVTVGPWATVLLMASENFAALNGGGTVYLHGGSLTLGENGASSTYHGKFNALTFGDDVTGMDLYKAGSGTLTFTGTNTFRGRTFVLGGRLQVNGQLTNSPIQLGFGTSLDGSGRVHRVGGSGGTVSPGVGAGLLESFGLALAPGHVFRAELNGTNAGVNGDLLRVTGPVVLGGATLQASISVGGKPGARYLLIENDGSDAVTNTFAGLPQGAVFSMGGMDFQISYTGGTGNDVVLTQLSQAPAPVLSGLQKTPGGGMQIGGTGVPGLTYEVQAATSLTSPFWVPLGTITAAPQTGLLQFLDADAANMPMRFYRFVIP